LHALKRARQKSIKINQRVEVLSPAISAKKVQTIGQSQQLKRLAAAYLAVARLGLHHAPAGAGLTGINVNIITKFELVLGDGLIVVVIVGV
jgi:hypothetical protein